jgi:hypothetical protein
LPRRTTLLSGRTMPLRAPATVCRAFGGFSVLPRAAPSTPSVTCHGGPAGTGRVPRARGLRRVLLAGRRDPVGRFGVRLDDLGDVAFLDVRGLLGHLGDRLGCLLGGLGRVLGERAEDRPSSPSAIRSPGRRRPSRPGTVLTHHGGVLDMYALRVGTGASAGHRTPDNLAGHHPAAPNLPDRPPGSVDGRVNDLPGGQRFSSPDKRTDADQITKVRFLRRKDQLRPFAEAGRLL